MSFDPLSPTTRKTKNRLLNVSVAYLLINFFDFEIDSLPLGLKSNLASLDLFMQAFFLISILYLTITFYLYSQEDRHSSKKRLKVEVIANIMNDFSNDIVQFCKEASLPLSSYETDDFKKLFSSLVDFTNGKITKQQLGKKTGEWLREYSGSSLNADITKRFFQVVLGHSFNARGLNSFLPGTTEKRIVRTRNFWDFYFPIVIACISITSVFFGKKLGEIIINQF